MLFEFSDKARDLQEQLIAFMDKHIYPNEPEFYRQLNEGDRWKVIPLLEDLKEKALIHIKRIEDSFKSPLTPQEKAMALLPKEYRMQVMDALVQSGANADEFMKAILELDSEKHGALAFLLANMPEEDLKSLNADFLISNVKYAFKARQALPYNRDVPEDIFLNYVLPYANVS